LWQIFNFTKRLLAQSGILIASPFSIFWTRRAARPQVANTGCLLMTTNGSLSNKEKEVAGD
jgi:hypothetical protein